MKLDINKFVLNKSTDNIYQILHDDNVLKFWSPKILAPFGIDNEYNKYLIKLELDKDDDNSDHMHLKKILLHIENLIKKKLDIEDIEFKSIIKLRPNKNDLIECRVKSIKKSIVTTIDYEDKTNNYLKTIFDLPKQSYIKIQFEIYGLWDYRDPDIKAKNKAGLIVYASKIIVLE